MPLEERRLGCNLVMTAQHKDADTGVSLVELARPYYCKLPEVRACIRRYEVRQTLFTVRVQNDVIAYRSEMEYTDDQRSHSITCFVIYRASHDGVLYLGYCRCREVRLHC